jgi:NDP-sugar pyrophosphorylase family protein
VIKLQNPLLLATFVNYATKHKGVFFDIPTDKQLAYIENAVHKDQKFRNALKGVIIGQFTVEEYYIYTQNSSQLNKRMMSLVITRLQDQMQLLVPGVLSKIG